MASSEVISQVLYTSEQPKKNKMAFVGIFSQTKLLFGPLVIQLVWYIFKQLFTSVSVTVETLSGDHTAAPVDYNNRLSMTSRQTAKMKLLPSVFSCLFRRLKIIVFAVNSRRHFPYLCDLIRDYKRRIENQR